MTFSITTIHNDVQHPNQHNNIRQNDNQHNYVQPYDYQHYNKNATE